MFNHQIRYTLLTLGLLSFSACGQKTIVIHPNGGMSAPYPPIQRTMPPIERPPVIQEEILIEQNPSLERVVTVPQNTPTLGTTVSSTTEGESGETTEPSLVTPTEENSGRMERIAFPVDEYSRIKKTGRSTVSGAIYVENSQNSQKILGKKVKLYLNPVTSYSKQWYEESYLGGYKMSKSDPRLFNYLKFTVSSENGKFDFFGLAPGYYYLVGTIKCAEECGFSEMTTIRLVKEVSVGSGVTNVDLTKNVP